MQSKWFAGSESSVPTAFEGEVCCCMVQNAASLLFQGWKYVLCVQIPACFARAVFFGVSRHCPRRGTQLYRGRSFLAHRWEVWCRRLGLLPMPYACVHVSGCFDGLMDF